MPEIISSPTLWLILKTWGLLLASGLLGWWLRGLFTKNQTSAKTDTSIWKERFETASREREDLRQKFEDLTSAHEKCTAARTELENSRSTLVSKDDFLSLETTNQDLTNSIDQKENRIVELIADRDKIRNELQATKNSGIDPKEIERLRKQISDRDNRISKLRHDLEYAPSQTELDRQSDKIQELQSEMKSLRKTTPDPAVNSLGAVASTSANNEDQLKLRIEALEVQRDNLKNDLAEAKSASSAMPDTSEIDSLKATASKREARIVELEKSLTSKEAPVESPVQKETASEEEPEPEKPTDTSGYQSLLGKYQGEDVEAKVQSGVVFNSAPSQVDDLKKISGVGPVLEKTLNENGVYQFRQIADWNEYNIWYFNKIMAFPGRIQRDEWIRQAKEFSS